MPNVRKRVRIGRITGLAVLALLVAARVRAETAPMRIYTTADGLEPSDVGNLVGDSKGYLWICTPRGVTRFDGEHFINFRIGDERRPGGVYCIHEVGGSYWIDNIRGGLFRFLPGVDFALSPASAAGATAPAEGPGLPMQKVSDEVFTACELCRRDFWAASSRGLFRLADHDGKAVLVPVDLHLPAEARSTLAVALIDEGLDGSLWLGTNKGLLRRLPGGQVVQYQFRRAGARDLDPPRFRNLVEAADGRIWVGFPSSLYRFDPERPATFAGSGPFVVRLLEARLPPPDGAPPAAGETIDYSGEVRALVEGAASDRAPEIGALYLHHDGTIWATSRDELLRFDGKAFRPFCHLPVSNKRLGWSILADDLGGSLWVAGRNALLRVALQGRAYDSVDGLAKTGVDSIHPAPGMLYAVNHDRSSYSRFDGRAFTHTRFEVSGPVASALLDHAGEWWVASGSRLYRFPRDERSGEAQSPRASRVYAEPQGMPGHPQFLFEDSRGDLWISTDAPPALARWRRSTDSLQTLTPAQGLPAAQVAHAFAEDSAGNLWLGFSEGSLGRYAGGRFSLVSANDLPARRITALHFDRAGRLWLASFGEGLRRADDPTMEPLHFTRYTTAEGLSSDNATCLVEDEQGRIYVGTADSVDRLTPETNHIVNYGPGDGWASGFVTSAARDAAGVLWFGRASDLLRLDPAPRREGGAPATVIVGLNVESSGGRVRRFGDRGELGRPNVLLGDLAPDENRLTIEFSSLGHSERLRYRYKLRESDRELKTTVQRTIRYERLAPGEYHFQVWALGPDGTAGTPATIVFRIVPFWRQWWFLLLVAGAGAILMAGWFRYQAARTIAVERLRTRIATDLHDDVGSSLSQIAILSELIRRELGPASPMNQRLSEIARTSRELVDSFSEIVWAINPNRDRLDDLSQKMRRFASDSFTACGIELTFDLREDAREVKLGPHVRREVFLLFKEAVNNIVRHSACRGARIEFGVEGGWAILVVEDDGQGFAASRATEGQGQSSMRRRAAGLNAALEIRSEEGRGTTVSLAVPLGRRHRQSYDFEARRAGRTAHPERRREPRTTT